MTDRELLELAAKAMGAVHADQWDNGSLLVSFDGKTARLWNPLTDDGDALRLAVKLGIQVGPNPASNEPMCFAWARQLGIGAQYEMHGTDPYAATRRAIVRAAAEIGRAMK